MPRRGYSAEIQKAKSLQREGLLGEAGAFIRTLAGRRLTRLERLELAFAANEAFLPAVAAQLLYRFVAGEGKHGPADDAERAEFAVALVNLGLTLNGITILEKLDLDRVPRAYPTLVLARFRLYQWLEAGPVIERCLAAGAFSKDERNALTMRLDHGIVLLHGRHLPAEAREEFRAVLDATGPERFRKIHWQALNMDAQALYSLGRLDACTARLREMERLYPDAEDEVTGSVVALWRALVGLRRHPGSRVARAAVQAVRTRLESRGPGRLLRDCDFYRALILRDPRLASQVYFGTPFPELRKKFLAQLGWSASALPAWLDLSPEGGYPAGGAARAPVLDLRTAECSLSGVRLKPGQGLHRLLAAVCSDFYEAPTCYELFERAYPLERIDPARAATRMRQGITRLRRWLRASGVALAIEESAGRYSPTALRPILIRHHLDPFEGLTPLSRGRGRSMRLDGVLERIRARIGGRPFRAAEIEPLLGCSRWAVVAVLRSAVSAGVLVREGRGPATRYRLP